MKFLVLALGGVLAMSARGPAHAEEFAACEDRLVLLQGQNDMISEGIASISHQRRPSETTPPSKLELERRALRVAKAYALAGIVEKYNAEVSLRTVVAKGTGETKITLRAKGRLIELRFCQEVKGDKMHVLAIGKIGDGKNE